MFQSSTKWFVESIAAGLAQVAEIREVFYEGDTRFQHVEILDLTHYGRSLVLDGKTQSTEADEFVYHEALVHPVLLAHPNPRHVFIAGGGEGATLRETLAHNTVELAVMVDIDQEVVELCKQHLSTLHQGSFDDPRAVIHFEDARSFLAETDSRFDVMILDLPDPLEGGPAALLYTDAFFSLVRERLNPEGLIVVQSGTSGPNNHSDIFTAIHNTLETIFPLVRAYSVTVPSFASPWGFIIGSLGRDPAAMDPDGIDQCINNRVTKKLSLYDGITHQRLFSLAKYLRIALDKERRIITEQNPIFVV